MISWVAMDRIVERKRAADAAYRKQGADKVLRSDAKRLTDGELLAKLSSFGIELDRPSLEWLCDQALSAEEIVRPLLDQRTFHGKHEQMESDWIWICLSALWQRWFPRQTFLRGAGRQDAGRLLTTGIRRRGGLPCVAGGVERCAAHPGQGRHAVDPGVR
jgi:hypothetical protein